MISMDLLPDRGKMRVVSHSRSQERDVSTRYLLTALLGNRLATDLVAAAHPERFALPLRGGIFFHRKGQP